MNFNKKTQKITVAILLTVVLLTGSWLIYGRVTREEAPASIDQINYGPPTDSEKESVDANKRNLDDRIKMEQDGGDTMPNQLANIVVGYSGYNESTGNVEASSYVSNVYEEGGTCTLVLTKDSREVVQSRAAIKDARNTSCGMIKIARTLLSPGTWSGKVTYESPTVGGSSSAFDIEVK